MIQRSDFKARVNWSPHFKSLPPDAQWPLRRAPCRLRQTFLSSTNPKGKTGRWRLSWPEHRLCLSRAVACFYCLVDRHPALIRRKVRHRPPMPPPRRVHRRCPQRLWNNRKQLLLPRPTCPQRPGKRRYERLPPHDKPLDVTSGVATDERQSICPANRVAGKTTGRIRLQM